MFKSSNRRLRVTASTICASFAVFLMVNVSVLFADDCWRWTGIQCCTLSNVNITCLGGGFTWECKAIIVEDAHVGVFYLVQSGGWTEPNVFCTYKECQYKAPHCGLLAGTCTWDAETTTRTCGDCPIPGQEMDC